MLVDGLAIRFLITSRTRPEWFTPRLEIYGEGLEIGADELKMTDDEAADVLFYLRDQDARAEVAAVAAGWPAVLGLAALNARSGHAERSGLLPDTLYDYLATELIQGASAEAQDGATIVALASVQEVETARILLGPAAEERLAAAEARGLLALVAGRHRIAMHPLIRELVVERFRSDSTRAGNVAELAPVAIEHRLWSEAQAIAEAAPNADFISRVLAAALPDLLRGGRVTSVRKWVELGRSAGAQSALLDYAEAELSLRDGATLRAYGLGVRAAEELEGDLAARAHLVAAQAAHLTERPASTATHAELATQLANSPETREGAAWVRFLSSLDLQSEDLGRLLDEYRAIARHGVDQSLTAATGAVALAHLEGGLFEALDTAEVALSVVHGDADPVRHTALLSSYSYALVTAGRYETALKTAQHLIEVANGYELEFPLRYAAFDKASALIGLRQFGLAGRVLSALEKQTRDDTGTYFVGNLAIRRARLYASVGDAERGLEVLTPGPAGGWIPATCGEYLGLRALLLAATKQFAEGTAAASEALSRSRGIETRSLALMAQALIALHSDGHADELVDAAIETEALDPIVIGLRVSPDLARHVASRRDRREWLQRLLIKSADISLAAAVGLHVPRAARRGQLLSARESEIHQLIAQGLTNEEIAKLLFISLSTTKVHVKHILDKLGVRSRVEAARLLDDDG